MGGPDALKGLIYAKEARIDIVERAGLLGQTVALGAQVLLFIEGGFHDELHIGINSEGIRPGGIPFEFLAEGLGILKG